MIEDKTLTADSEKNKSHAQSGDSSLSGKKDSIKDLQILVDKIKNDVDNHATKIKDVNQIMFFVVIILLVMVGAIIFELQIAIWESKQSNSINITIPK